MTVVGTVWTTRPHVLEQVGGPNDDGDVRRLVRLTSRVLVKRTRVIMVMSQTVGPRIPVYP